MSHNPTSTNLSADAERQSLGEKFSTVYAELAAFRPVHDALGDRCEQEVARRTGIPRHWSLRTEVESNLYLSELENVQREFSFDPIDDKLNEIYGRLDPLVRAIQDASALDIAGLALKARAVASAMPELWEEALDDLDYAPRLVRDLIENLCGFANVDLPALGPKRPQAGLN